MFLKNCFYPPELMNLLQAQCSAHDSSIIDVPVIITHPSPYSIVQHLYHTDPGQAGWTLQADVRVRGRT